MSAAPLGGVNHASLLRFLATRRWFAEKGREIVAAELCDVAPLPDVAAVLARVRVHLDGENPVDYQLPLAVRTHTEDPALVARDGDHAAIDALVDPEFLRRISRAFTRDETIGRWSFTSLTDLADLGPPRPLTGEQSNTSIALGDRALLKFYRRLAPGEHPDVEVPRFLATRTPFRGAPALLGVAHLHEETGPPTVTAALHEYIPGAVDGWEHVLARLRAGADPSPELTALGALTRELHVALASVDDDPAFTPEPTRDVDLDRWQSATAAQIHRALTRLGEQHTTLPEALRPAIRDILAQTEALVALARAPLDASTLGPRIRHHGDYHLGQTLHTAEGWRIVDFEGEPTRPLHERRIKHHPLRDVAGMLRSFAYAAAAADTPDAAPRLRAAFLAGYDPTLADDPRRAPLLQLFTLEKLFYELTYELGSRPDWAWIPLAGITALLP